MLSLNPVLSFFRIHRRPLVGVDISSSSVKVLELSRQNGTYRVETYGAESLDPQSIVEKNIKAVDKVSDAIRRVVHRAGVSRTSAAIAVAGSAVITRIIQMNAEFTEAQIEEQIEVEADRYIPYPLEEVYFDFEILGLSAKDPDMLDVLLAACRLETLDIRVAAVTGAGLTTDVVDVESLAMERAFALFANQLPAEDVQKNIALVDIGGNTTTLYVFRDRRSIYNRDQAFGGKHLTDEIQKRYGLSLEEAVAAQKYGGLPEDYTKEVLEPFKETVVQQIGRALQVFFSSTEASEVQYIILAGGVALLPGLEVAIQSKLGKKTLIANPFAGMQLSDRVGRSALNEDAPGLMMSCGLALRNFDYESH